MPNNEIRRLRKKLAVFNTESSYVVFHDLIQFSNNFSDSTSTREIINKLKAKYNKELQQLENQQNKYIQTSFL